MSPPIAVTQVKQLLKKNLIEDTRNPKRTCCEHCCTILVIFLIGYLVGMPNREGFPGQDTPRPQKDKPAVFKGGGVFHQIQDSEDYTYLHDPLDRLFLTNRRTSGYDEERNPCGSCDRLFVLEGKHAEGFKAFLKSRYEGMYDGRKDEVCPIDNIVTGKSFQAYADEGKRTCAAVVWSGDDLTEYTVYTNRTYGYIDNHGKFMASTDYYSPYELLRPWVAWPSVSISAEEMRAQRCYSKRASDKCKSTFNKLYAPPDGKYSRQRESWFVTLDLLVHEFIEKQTNSKPKMGFHKDGARQCQDIEVGDTDYRNHGCDWYYTHPDSCGQHDFFRFKAKKICCACNGGTNGPPHRQYMVIPAPQYVSETEFQSYSNSSRMGQAFTIVMGVILTVVNIVLFFTMIGRMITEREQKLKEGLRMMGTSNSAYYGHWFAHSCVISLIYAFLLTSVWHGMKVFKTFYISLFFCAFLLYASIIAFAYLFSCFFTQPRTGSLIGTMIYFLTSFLAVIPLQGGVDILFLLFPQVAWAKYIACLMTGEYEGWTDDVEIDGFLTLSGCVLWMLLDFVLLHLGWVYFDMVIPHENSSSQKPWYVCDPSYWKGTQGLITSEDQGSHIELGPVLEPEEGVQPTHRQVRAHDLEAPETSTGEPLMEEVSRSLDEMLTVRGRASLFEIPTAEELVNVKQQQCVTVKDLCVYFKGVYNEEIKAVDGVNFHMFPGEIFCLLGHNGAGKSTTMSVISGMLKATKGQVVVYGKRVPQDMEIVRKRMGFCPQHDVLFADLTVREHIALFTQLSGRERVTTESMVELVRAVGLGDRIDFPTTALSGGMKRKLSVGITFSGDPNLVILDEPTSGMDPFSRRVLWDFLKLRKEGRVLLLTTHFMDEADVLGDRIAIMRAGQVQTCGSPQFLKRKFGCGYVLTVVMAEDKQELHEPVKNLIRQATQDARVEFSGVGKEILANIPFDCEQRLPDVLTNIGLNKDTLRIGTFGISLTNLEEVFLKVASGDHGSKAQFNETERIFHQESEHHQPVEAAFVMPNQGGTILEQMFALLVRRQQSAVRDMKAFSVGCMVPILMVFGACWLGRRFINNSVPSLASLPRVELSLADLQVTYAVSEKDPHESYPEGTIFLNGDVNESEYTGGTYKCIRGSYNLEPSTTCSFETTVNGMELPMGYLQQCEKNVASRELTLSKTTYCKARFVKMLLNLGEEMMRSGKTDVGAALIDGFPVLSLNTSHVAHTTPLAVKALFEWTQAGLAKVSNSIFDKTVLEKQYYATRTVMFQALASMMVAVLSNFAFCYVPIAVLGFVLMEKTKDVKHQLLISGCSAKAYWISMLLWDSLIAMFPVLMLYVFLRMYDFEAFIKYAEASCTLLLLFVPAAVSSAYVLTHMINGPAMGNTCLLLCNGICALILVQLFFIMDFVWRAFPAYASFAYSFEELTITQDSDLQADNPFKQLNASQFVMDLVNVNCGPISEAWGKMQDLVEQRGGEYELMGSNYTYYSNLRGMAMTCEWVWKCQFWTPIVKSIGFLLPGFNLLDGLARIAGRHAVVHLFIPEGVRYLGTQAEDFLQRQIRDFLSSCGRSVKPIASVSKKDENKTCESYKRQAKRNLEALTEKDGNCSLQLSYLSALDQLAAQTIGGFLSQGGPMIKQAVAEFSAPLKQAFLPMLQELYKIKPDDPVFHGEDPDHFFDNMFRQLTDGIERTFEAHIAGVMHGNLQSETWLTDQLYGLVARLLSDPAGVFGFTIATEGDGLKLLAECVAEVPNGGTHLALASLLEAHGATLTSKIKDWMDKQADSQDLPDFADQMLPVIATRKKDIFGGGCAWGPRFGPMFLSSLLPDFFNATSSGSFLNTTSFGPIDVMIPCNFGLEGNDGVVSFGNVLELIILIPTTGDSFLRLALLAVMYTLIAVLIEDIRQSPRFSKWSANKTPCPPEMLSLEDENVKAEKQRVDNLDPTKQIMYVSRLRKVFGGFFGKTTHAVRGVNWAADRGMVFGLLGVNGAGKTTSFKMMSGILTPSDGEVRILGISVLEETARARQFIGYCPQFDALIERLTVTEHLYLYGRMKGIKGQDLGTAVNSKLTEMQLDLYRTRRAGNLSGGNKRKLSVAMAIIGEPPVIFLDEPSTGMDPFARRFMWGVIQDVAEKRKQSVVVLTTHSMEEAEALCSCIAIQVDGQLRCLGSAQQLKSQYGHGYEVSVKFASVEEDVIRRTAAAWNVTDLTSLLDRTTALQLFQDDPSKLATSTHITGPLPESVSEVNVRILAEWSCTFDRMRAFHLFLTSPEGAKQEPGSVLLIESHGLTAKWRLQNMVDMGVAQLMQDVQNSKSAYCVADFACNQASLEQIFNAFAAQQEAGGNVGITAPPGASNQMADNAVALAATVVSTVAS